MSKKVIGIELGSTRIKAVMIDENAKVLAEGGFEWENQYIGGYWTYALEDVWKGLQECYRELNENYKTKYSEDIKEIDSLGISAMMHGYLAFDKDEKLLVPFRTWRNTTTEQAADELSEKFKFNIPQRWSVSHYYQEILKGEEYVKDIEFLTTLAGYVHYKLTGEKVLGVGDASGMFPVKENTYNVDMMKDFNTLISEKGISKKFEEILPKVLLAGEDAGVLTEEGAKLLDPAGNLKAGIKMCPPEGDGETGMTATNSVEPKTAIVSAGSSGFLMVVLEKELKKYYKEIDIIMTPTGHPVAMVHVNNFSSEINAWVDMFKEMSQMLGVEISKGELFEMLFKKSLESDANVGYLTGYNFLSGEHIAGVEKGRPLFLRLPEGKLNIANFMQMQLYSALGSLSIGFDILKKEDVEIKEVFGHGGFFKTEFVGQNAMSAALSAPVTVMENAGEGGAWGVAILALYLCDNDVAFEEFLNNLFRNNKKNTVVANDEEKAKFKKFMTLYKKGLDVEKIASDVM